MASLEIGVDARALAGRAMRGIGVYLEGMLGALSDRFPEDRLHLLVPGDGDGSLPGALMRDNVIAHRSRVPGRLLYAAGAVVGRPRLDRLIDARLDVMWIPAPSPAVVSGDLPYALTLHDLAFDERPSDFTAYERLWHRAARPRRQARNAARVLAVSAATRADALRRWGLEPALVDVVSPGVRPARAPSAAAIEATRRRHGLGERHLLFVGALEPRKAPDVLVAAFTRARQAGLDAELVLVGTGRLAGSLTAPGVHVLGPVDDDERSALYAGALALVAPSHAEGFGFPPLEAAAAGTPSVVSDLPAFAETLGDGALRIRPGDVGALSDALVRIAGDPALRESLSTIARQRSATYTWERAAAAARSSLAKAAGG